MSLFGVIVCTPKGRGSQLLLRIFKGSMKAKDMVTCLKELKKQIKGRKLLLIWDGLPAHRAKVVTEYLNTQKNWLRVERFPGYAPELNPIEYLWSAMKRKDLANHPAEGLKKLRRSVWRAKRRLGNKKLLRGFLEASGLY